MITSPIPTLIFQSSGIPGLIKINDTLVGELGSDIHETLTLPLSPNGIFYIEFTPLVNQEGQGYFCPITRKITSKDGTLVIPEVPELWDHLSICEWPGNLFEITANPIYLSIPPQYSVIPKTIDQISYDLNGDGQEEIATLFMDQCLHLVIEDPVSDRILFDYTPLHSGDIAGLTLKDVTGSGTPDLLIRGTVGASTESLAVVSHIHNEYQVLLDQYGHGIHLIEGSPIKIQVLQRIHDICQHGILFTYEYEDRRFLCRSRDVVWYWGDPKWPETPDDTCRAFLDAFAVDASKEAMGYLDHSFSESISYQELKNILGDFSQWTSPKYTYPSYLPSGIHLALVYNVQPHFQKIKLYSFGIKESPSTQGKYKITSITAL